MDDLTKRLGEGSVDCIAFGVMEEGGGLLSCWRKTKKEVTKNSFSNQLLKQDIRGTLGGVRSRRCQSFLDREGRLGWEQTSGLQTQDLVLIK